MGWRIKLKNGNEDDAVTGWRKVIYFHPGERSRMKRRIRRRDRQQERLALRERAKQ